jgi:hypothetical protein
VDSPVICRVDIEIELDELFKILGQKALRSKSRRSKIAGGLVVAKVLPHSTASARGLDA